MTKAVSRQPLTEKAVFQCQFVWDLWWTKWQWDGLLSEHFGFT